jgi:hypothetical protein
MDEDEGGDAEEDEEERKSKSQVPILQKKDGAKPDVKTTQQPATDNKPANTSNTSASVLPFDIFGATSPNNNNGNQGTNGVSNNNTAGTGKKTDLDILSELFAPGSGSGNGNSNTSNAGVSMTNLNTTPLDNSNSGLSSLPFNVFDSPAPKPAANTSTSTSKYPAAVVYESKTLSVKFAYDVHPSTPEVMEVTALFSNSGNAAMVNFDFQVAVPKFIVLKMQPPSSTTLNAGAGIASPAVTQSIRLENTLHGKKKIMIKVRLNYQQNGQSIVEDTQISQFPDTSAT